MRYLVKWKGFARRQWIPEEDMMHAKDLLRRYHDQAEIPLTPFLQLGEEPELETEGSPLRPCSSLDPSDSGRSLPEVNMPPPPSPPTAAQLASDSPPTTPRASPSSAPPLLRRSPRFLT